ncbi:TetR/AcrR family transcriptional regulator [Neobacillus sp. Marseille-QA0830]
MKQSNSKEKILNAASALFRKQGYHATSLSQITELSDAPRGSVYYYFPGGKEELAKEAIQQTGIRIKHQIHESLSLFEDTALGVNHWIKRIAEKLEQKGESVTVSLVAMSSEVWSSSETLRQTCQEVYGEWEQLYVEKLVCSGYPPEEARRLATAIQSWIEGAYTLSLTKQSTEPLHIVGEQVFKILAKN